ncbi:glucosyltransferase domain-containing protein [Morganella morganii]|uniref:glucosyltransferase domain-containing protein n=1 Tax=Morganella morganii TaxID=582 RepID=UPI0030D0A3CD
MINFLEKKINIYHYIILSLIFTFPLILADMFFRDDISRALFYNVGLSRLGRPLADFVYSILTGFSAGADLSPLPLLLSSLALAFTAFIFGRILFEKTNVITLVSSIPIIISPFFLQNLSYKYDCLPMSLGLLFSIIPFIITKRSLYGVIFPICSIIVSISFYQVSINVFITIAISLFTISILRNGISYKDIKIALWRMVQLIIAILLYYITIVPLFLSKIGEDRSNVASLNEVINNITRLNQDVMTLSTHYMSYIYIILICLFIINVIFLSFSGNKNFLSSLSLILIALISTVLSYLMIGGVSLILKEGISGYRAYVSFGFFCSFVFFIILNGTRNIQFRLFEFIIASLICIYFISYSYAYGNSIKSQRAYEYHILDNVFFYLSSIENISNKVVFTSGEIKIAPLSLPFNKFNKTIINQNENTQWMPRFLLSSYGINIDWKWGTYEDLRKKAKNNELKVIVRNDNFIIYEIDKDKILVLFTSL